jgi:hypothetical protein
MPPGARRWPGTLDRMDWLSVAMVAFAAFIVGMLLVSRVVAWVAGLVLVLRSPTEATEKAGLSLAQVFLHSGPWALALALAALYYVASLPQSIWLWAVLGGSGFAVAVMVFAVAMAHLRQRRGIAALVPLTPERLQKIRRRFFWGNMLFYGGFCSAWLLYMWPQLGQSMGLVFFVIGVCLGGGYVFSWFMWQFYGASLQARESARQRAERSGAV